jgi:hypothetical protein
MECFDTIDCGAIESFDRKFGSSESNDSNNTIRVTRKDSKLDGRSRIRSVKQIEAYKRNFRKEDSIELRLRELDVRMRHLQSLVLRVLGDKNMIIINQVFQNILRIFSRDISWYFIASSGLPWS